MTGTCASCGETITVTLPKLNKTDYDYSVTKAATCSATGKGRYTWKTTTYGTFSFDTTIAKTAHSYKEEVTAPTCTEKGFTTHTCSVCGDSYKDTETLALGHDFVGGVCTRCGEKDPDIPDASGQCGDNLYWSFNRESGELTITGSGDMWNYLYGETATPWGSERHNIKSVSLPDGLSKIGRNAFADLDNLRSITIPESVIEIGIMAFYGCTNMTDATILNRDCIININDQSQYHGGMLIESFCDTFGSDSTICGYKNSTAEKYANRWHHPFRAIDEAPDKPFRFDDVKESSAFFFDPVYWAYEHDPQITTGTDATHFSPDKTCTRAQVVTFLWRAAGSPEPKNVKTPFTDVQAGAYYEKAVAWAVENGITSGTSKTTFSPNSTCTRGQIVTFLWRFVGSPEVSTAGTQFRDVVSGAYYEKAVVWAVKSGITNGTSRVAFSPEAKCTRAQVVTFLYRSQGHALEPVEYKGLVGISMPTKDLWRWNRDGTAMQRLLEDSGCDVELQFAANDISRQITQIETMIAHGARTLIIAAIDGNALGVVLDQAKEAGCTVIAYDRPIGSNSVSYYVSFDNYAVGVAQGKYIVDKLNLATAGSKVYNIEFVGGAPDDGNAYVFYDGAMSVLRKYIDAGTLNVASGQFTHFEDVATQWWSSEKAQERFEKILSTYYTNRPLHAVVCSNDSTAQGVAAALTNVYRNSVYPIITGQDCDIVSVMNILNGKQEMSVFKDTNDLAAKAVEMAVAIVNGKTVPVNSSFSLDGDSITPSYLCEPKICTKDNLRQLLIDSGYYTEEELGLR